MSTGSRFTEHALRLVIYSHAFSPQIGGVETFSGYLAWGLSRGTYQGEFSQFTVTVITQTPGPPDPALPDQPFEVVRRPGMRLLWRVIGAADRVLLAGPAILPLLFSLIRRKPVIVTHHGYQAICPNGLLLHLPTNHTCPGYFSARRYVECFKCNLRDAKSLGSARLLLLTFVRRTLSRLANFNVAVSGHVANRIALPKSKIVCNGIPNHPGDAHTTQTASLCFAYIGRLVAEKGLLVLIEAARILKGRKLAFQLVVIGDGPQRTALQQQVSSLALDEDVRFLGFRVGPQLDDALSRISVVVVPSIWEEPAPFSVLEQMMLGRLIIASNLGGLPEQIGDSGLTFPAGDASALAEQMTRVLRQPELITALGGKARERAQRLYSLESMLSRYRTLLN